MAFPDDWSGYVEINPAEPGGAVTDFTYLVSLNSFPADFWEAAQADGDDVRASDEANAELAVDRIHWTNGGSSGSGLLAVRYTGAVDTDSRIRIWVGNASATLPAASDTYGSDNAYDSGVEGFWPDGLGNDRTNHNNDMSPSGSPTVGGEAGPIAGSLATLLNGSSQYGYAAASVPTTQPFMLYGHVNLTTTNPGSDGHLITVGDTSGTTNCVRLMFIDAANACRYNITPSPGTARSASASTTIAAGAWRSVIGRETSTTSRGIIYEGVEEATQTSSTTLASGALDTISIGVLAQATPIHFLSGQVSMMRLDTTARSNDYLIYWRTMLADSDQSDFYGTPAWTDATPPEPLAEGVWGQFTLHSAKGTTAEITALSGENPYFPRYLDLAACRAAGLTLHASLDGIDNMVVVTTDHSSGTGRGAGGTFDNIEDSWDWLSTALYTGADQREACQPVLDAANNRILYFAHDDTSNFQTYNQQHAVVMSSTNGVTLSSLDEDICPFVSNHTGYGQFLNNFNNSGQWTAVHHIASGEDYWLGSSYATNPTEFTFGEHFFTQLSHIIGTDKCISSGAWLANFGGRTWYIGLIEAREAVDLNSISLVAIEVSFIPGRAPRPVGGYYTLFADTDAADATYSLTGDYSLVSQNGNLYLIGTGRESDDTQHVVLLKMSTTVAASYTAPIVPVTSTGRLVVPNNRANVFEWDAANDALPSDITITAVSGTNASSQTIGTGYTLLTGSGSSQTLRLTLANYNIDPSEHDVVDFTIWNWKLGDKQNNQQAIIKFGQDSNAAAVYFNTDTNSPGGRMRVYDTNVAVYDDDPHILPFNAGSADTANYARTRGFHITFRLMDQGDKLLVLLTDPQRNPYNDAQCVFYLDLTGYTITWEDCFAQLFVTSTGGGFLANSMSFSKLTIDTYSTVNMPASSTSGIVRSVSANVDAGVETFVTSHS